MHIKDRVGNFHYFLFFTRFILTFHSIYLYFYDIYRKTGDREDFEKIITDHANAAGNISSFNNI